MNIRRSFLWATMLACLGSPVAGQQPEAERTGTPATLAEPTAEEVDEARKKRLLPKPLDTIESNLRDLEQNGLLSIVSGRKEIINNGQDEAIVWTVRANRPLTCRYITMQVEALSDVRLYKTLGVETNDTSLLEVHSLKLYYSPQLEERAANSSLFARDDFFTMWVYLDPVEARKIRSLGADRAIFRAPQRR